LFFPDDCRLCNLPLTRISRYPVCEACLHKIEPLSAEFFCVLCRSPFASGASLDETGRCPLCVEGSRGFDAAYSYGSYEGPLRDLVHLFKYRRIRSLEKPLGRMLCLALPREEQADLIVPVPMHWWRKWNRGFNQADLLARMVARRTGIPAKSVLQRGRRTAAQAGLTLAQRRENLTGVFHVRGRNRVEGRRVLLVDDVFTTGATASACAAALKRAGARSVVLLTLARVDRRWAELPTHEKISGDT
jgi:ComF family protein